MLMPNTNRIIASLVYLIVDIAYVLSSKSYYSNVVQKIQGKAMYVPNERLWAAAMSYFALVIGWLFLVAPNVENKSTTLQQSALYGFVYGFAVYGVFNGTNHVMFRNYDIAVVLRDTVWGVSWLTAFTVLYKIYLMKA
jgi:uncharacterized membrane protein